MYLLNVIDVGLKEKTMRLWHKDLIPYLPKMQLLGQWRELCCIGVNLANDHTPNHILVNPILDYSPEHFEYFCNMVIREMKVRKFEINEQTLKTLQQNIRAWRLYLGLELPFDYVGNWDMNLEDELFDDWHNNRYLRQCYYNLEEKYDRGGVPQDEWMRIFSNFGGI